MISKLRLYDFRAYKEAELDLDGEFNLIIGPNGVGKTSLLEAMMHLGLGGSSWSERSSDVIREGQPYAIVVGHGSSRGKNISIKLKRGGRKEVMSGGKRVPKMSVLLGIFPMTAVGPQEIDLIKGSPSVRRRMIDSALCQFSPEYTTALGRYKKLILERNAALRGVRSGQLAGGHVLIETWDDAIAPEAGTIMAARNRLVEQISASSGEIYLEIMGGGGGELSIEYKPTISLSGLDRNGIVESVKKELASRRRSDIERGETSIGPHRDDLLFVRNGERLSRFGSWGQARAASIAAILAVSNVLHKEADDAVTLLLDDCFAELDPENTSRFIDVASRFGQVVLASPREIDLPGDKTGARFVFDGVGSIRREY